MTWQIIDDRACVLGEGALWHPQRRELFWFDILDRQLLDGSGNCWQFDELVSACGWLADNRLLIASETALYSYNLDTLVQSKLVDLEADRPETRSNDGRTDLQGGFWISTMGKQAEVGLGAIYRLYRGELRQLFADMTIPNAICFAPDGTRAFFADTATRTIQRVALDADGWPIGRPEIHIDLRDHGLNPDGAIVTADGLLVNAQWGAARVAVYDADGGFLRAIALPTDHVTCPALANGKLYVTSAKQGLSQAQLGAQPHAGKTFAVDIDLVAHDAPQVVL